MNSQQTNINILVIKVNFYKYFFISLDYFYIRQSFIDFYNKKKAAGLAAFKTVLLKWI